MLGRFELLFSILVPWIAAGVAYVLLRSRNPRRLPRGSHVSKGTKGTTKEEAPGTRWSRLGVNFGHWLQDLTLTAVVVLCILNLWGTLPSLIVLDFPVWLNWLGIFGVWFQYGWQVAIVAYNVNFIPNTKPMTPRYVLAKGGPYRLMRHPTYFNYVAVALFLFLATGIWIVLLGALGWVALPRQARAEEAALEERFGRVYTAYAATTGRFFPRIRHHRDVSPRKKSHPRTANS